MSTLKEKAEEILQEKTDKLTSGEFLDTNTVFGITGTFDDKRDEYVETMESPQIMDLTAEDCVEVTSYPNTNDTVVNSMTSVVSRLGYSALAQEIGLTDDILKEGNTVLGINGIVQEGIDTSDATATEEDIAGGKTAYVDGQEITGRVVTHEEGDTFSNISPRVDEVDVEYTIVYGDMDHDDNVLLRPGSAVYLMVPNEDIASAAGLTSNILKAGETVLGVEGTYTESGLQYHTFNIGDEITIHFDILLDEITDFCEQASITDDKQIKIIDSDDNKFCVMLGYGKPTYIGDSYNSTAVGIAVDVDTASVYLVVNDIDGTGSIKVSTIETGMSSSLFKANMAVGDLKDLCQVLGDTTVTITASFGMFEDFSTICLIDDNCELINKTGYEISSETPIIEY